MRDFSAAFKKKNKRTETGSGVKAKGKDTEHQSAHRGGDRNRLMRESLTVEDSETSGFARKCSWGTEQKETFDGWPCDSNSEISIRWILVFTYHRKRINL